MSLTKFGERFELRSEVEIDVEPAQVWSILIDFPKHEQWNPFWCRIKGQAHPSARVSYVLTPPGGHSMSVKRYIDAYEEANELRWNGGYGWGWLLRSEQTFRLSRAGERRARLIVAENLRGPGVTGINSVSMVIARGQALMNQALKRHLEAASR